MGKRQGGGKEILNFSAYYPLLVGAGVVVVKLMFTSERLKAMVIPPLEQATGRSVSINEISLDVFPSIALVIEGVRVSNLEGEGFSPEPFLALESLRLNVKLMPLLQSRFEINSLEMENPKILLEVTSAKRTNYSNLTTGGKAPDTARTRPPGEEGKPGSSTAPAFAVANLLVHGGAVDYVDHTDNSLVRVRNLELAMEVTGEGNSIIVTGNATTDSLTYGSVETPESWPVARCLPRKRAR